MDGNISDDLIYGPNGAIYGSDFNGDTVFKINPDGTVSAFVSGIQNPNGLAFDNNQNLYVVGWGQGIILEGRSVRNKRRFDQWTCQSFWANTNVK